MTEFKNDIAYDEQVFERALEILKKDEVETDLPQLKRIYKYSTKYIKKVFNEEDYCSINLQPLGRAYYHIYDITKIKQTKLNRLRYGKIFSEEHKKRLENQSKVWQKKYDDSLDVFEKYRPKENVSKYYQLLPIIQNLRRRIKRRKISSHEVEEIQNNID